MNQDVVVAVAGVLATGVAAQWLWLRLRVPAIVFLLAAGLIAGPFTGWLDPNETFGGAGLGLAIARGLVEAHFGHICIEEQPGGRVAFELPAA